GRLRITEQGESLNERYGLPAIAMRIFEQAFHALSLSRSGASQPERVEPFWRETMELLADESSRAYRALVFDDPQFFDFFRQVTPIEVIERMQIGSRPATRDERGGIATFRSILWVHAWAQCRYMLPGWLGAGSALAAAVEKLGIDVLKTMYREWYFFEGLID